MNKTIGYLLRRLSSLTLVIAVVLTAAACGFVEQGDAPLEAEPGQVRIQELNSLCSVQVRGVGTLDVERDYLPRVIACENYNAPLETLKAQAIAARTYAAFITTSERRALEPGTRDQDYRCTNRPPLDIHRQAVRETAGQMLTHNGSVFASFYSAGAIPSTSTCEPRASDRDPTNTERRITYNRGRTGNQVRKTSLGSATSPANRGAMSQNGASCLANAGWNAERILRFYYGDDVRLQRGPSGTCGVDTGVSLPEEPGAPRCDSITDPILADICRGGGTEPPTNLCAGPEEAVRILPRSAWNARPPRHNSGTHTPNRITIHHTVTHTGQNHDNGTLIRNIQHDHMSRSTTPFSDIAYHFLIPHDGTIYMGRPENQQGAHVRNGNDGNLGIALLGNFQNEQPSDAQLKAAARLVRHLSEKYSIALNRDRVKGHGEQYPSACPGTHLKSRLNELVEWAKADTVCTDDESEEDGESDRDLPGYQYVRITGVSDLPAGHNDTVAGFEIDSIYMERPMPSGSHIGYVDAIVSSRGVSNPGAVQNAPDNTSCDNRAETVAGLPSGAELVVKLASPLKPGDILFVTQHAYQAAISDCSGSGSVKVSVSEDGRSWKVLSHEAVGNYRVSLREQHFELNAEDEIAEGSGGFEFIVPRAGQWYRPDMKFKMHVTHPGVVSVRYEADQYVLGTASDRSSGFSFEKEFNEFGQRRIHAYGLDAGGRVLASKEITVTVTAFDGTIPGGRTEPGAVPGAGSANVNSTLANRLATEAGRCLSPYSSRPGPRCTNGSGGYSTGQCWMFVKDAMDRAGLKWEQMASGPCAGAFHPSAYGFKCNADANPTRLRQIGLQRIDVPVTQAPRGAVIGWNRGCLGYHSTHGHIEISMGNGVACSDFCGRIRGNASCASVYVPVN